MNELDSISWPLTLDPEAAEALFDDCPVCEELRRQLESGELKEFSVTIETEEEQVN